MIRRQQERPESKERTQAPQSFQGHQSVQGPRPMHHEGADRPQLQTPPPPHPLTMQFRRERSADWRSKTSRPGSRPRPSRFRPSR